MGSGSAIARTIVEVTTDEGLVGLDETAGADSAAIINGRFAARLTGLDPHERVTAHRRCVPLIHDYGTAQHAVELAAFAGVEIALFAREQVAATGARMFEFKVARHSVECDIATVQEVRRALGPEVLIGVDANMRYTVDQARSFLRATAREAIDSIEEPCASLADCSRIRRDFGIPVSTHCTDFDAIIAHPDIDSVVGAVDAQGGIGRTFELAAIAHSHGRRYWLRSCVELGIGWAAMVHLGMAGRALDRPAHALIQWIEDDLVDGPVWHVRDGGVVPPEKAGLGVVLDQDALHRRAERFAKQGERTYFDAP